MQKSLYFITMVYLLIGFTWLLFGTYVIGIMEAKTPETDLRILYNYKNGIFILVSGAALFFLLKKHGNHLFRAEDNYQRLFEGSPGSSFVMEKQSLKLLAVNEIMVKKYGFAKEELLRMTALDIRPVEERERLTKYLNSDHKEGHETGLWIHQKENGDCFYVLVSHHSISFQHKEAYMVIGIDVDEKIKNEERLEEIRWQNSHKLRQPTSNIKGLIGLLRSNEPTDPQIISLLNASVNSLEEVIQDINITNT
jgi:PAS domain S-box-containing protein